MRIAVLVLLSLLPSGAAWAGAPAVRVIPVQSNIPRSYLIFGYGTDRLGNGPYLDQNGNALTIGGVPRTILVRGVGRKTHVRTVLKRVIPAAKQSK